MKWRKSEILKIFSLFKRKQLLFKFPGMRTIQDERSMNIKSRKTMNIKFWIAKKVCVLSLTSNSQFLFTVITIYIIFKDIRFENNWFEKVRTNSMRDRGLIKYTTKFAKKKGVERVLGECNIFTLLNKRLMGREQI